ncbi:MAG: DegT/DnrJ/EryC1/StrS family aminotransferase [Candidatus Gottesmanbacteria bacterium]|nr:DegT/DnrJ/EryC1/StrS family aminotransferase [Candidatus Gottesmanbacteria bacterium]
MIPIFDLTREYKTINKELNTAFTQTAKSGSFILGQNVSLFEKEFGHFVHTSYAVGLASGTDALTLGLRALGVGNGDEVILPANSYPTAFGVAQSGARIRLVDVKSDGTMNPVSLAHVITRRTRAVVPVHLYGNPADIVSIQKIIGLTKIVLVEDAAQAHGTPSAGSMGDIGCFSFYPTKNLGALGDAGMVVTNRKDVAERLKRLRMYGETKRYESVEVSGVSRLDELQAALLRVKLRHLAEWVASRREIAKQYIEELRGVGDIQFVTDNPKSCYHLFVIRTKRRYALRAYLTARGIGTAIHYPAPIHLVRAFRDLGYKHGDFPVSEALSQEILSIPMFPSLTNGEILRVVRTIKKYFQ